MIEIFETFETLASLILYIKFMRLLSSNSTEGSMVADSRPDL